MNEYKNFSMQFQRKGYGRIFVEKEKVNITDDF